MLDKEELIHVLKDELYRYGRIENNDTNKIMDHMMQMNLTLTDMTSIINALYENVILKHNVKKFITLYKKKNESLAINSATTDTAYIVKKALIITFLMILNDEYKAQQRHKQCI